MRGRILAACGAALLLLGGCTTQVDFRDTVSGAKDAVFPSLVYIRTVRKALERGKDDKA